MAVVTIMTGAGARVGRVLCDAAPPASMDALGARLAAAWGRLARLFAASAKSSIRDGRPSHVAAGHDVSDVLAATVMPLAARR